MSEPTTKAPPIVLIHGLWMTARSWDRWVEYYRAKGHEVIVPTYPGFEIEVEALREKPEVIAEASVPETLDHHPATFQIPLLLDPPRGDRSRILDDVCGDRDPVPGIDLPAIPKLQTGAVLPVQARSPLNVFPTSATPYSRDALSVNVCLPLNVDPATVTS